MKAEKPERIAIYLLAMLQVPALIEQRSHYVDYKHHDTTDTNNSGVFYWLRNALRYCDTTSPHWFITTQTKFT